MLQNALNYRQNLCSARIFLNMFGLVLDDVSEIDENTRINIYLKDTDLAVGKVVFSGDKVVMKASFNNDSLEADYKMATTDGFIDEEDAGAVFIDWGTNIGFKMKNDSGEFFGEVLLESVMDSVFGLNCCCHTWLRGKFAGKEISLKFQRDGAAFQADIWDDLNDEHFLIEPFNEFNGYLRHTINEGKYQKPEKSWSSYEHQKYMTIASGWDPDKRTTLHSFFKEKRYDKAIEEKSEIIPVEMINGKPSLQQKGYLMQAIDNTFVSGINNIRNVLAFGNTSFINGCINACFDSWSQEDLKAIFGIERAKDFYQDGSPNLITAYFNPGTENPFHLGENQLKLLTKN